MKFVPFLLVTLIFLTSCGTADLGDSKTKALILPDVKEYSTEDQNKVADELEFLMKNYNPKPVSVVFLKDYHIMQKETRIAKKALKAK